VSNDETASLTAEVIACEEIHELPGDWNAATLRALLAGLEFEAADVADTDLMDLALMALGDLDPHVAGMAVLEAVFADTMASGVRANLSSDLDGERPWENVADLSHQAGIFTATVLLQRAFPRSYGKPVATRVEVAFAAAQEPDAALLQKAPPAVLLRALAPGLGERSIVNRLYEESLREGPFPEAAHILWRRNLCPDPADPRRVLAEFFGAQSILGSLAGAAPWQVKVALEPDA
jgi:hypothetical protein